MWDLTVSSISSYTRLRNAVLYSIIFKLHEYVCMLIREHPKKELFQDTAMFIEIFSSISIGLKVFFW